MLVLDILFFISSTSIYFFLRVSICFFEYLISLMLHLPFFCNPFIIFVIVVLRSSLVIQMTGSSPGVILLTIFAFDNGHIFLPFHIACNF